MNKSIRKLIKISKIVLIKQSWVGLIHNNDIFYHLFHIYHMYAKPFAFWFYFMSWTEFAVYDLNNCSSNSGSSKIRYWVILFFWIKATAFFNLYRTAPYFDMSLSLGMNTCIKLYYYFSYFILKSIFSGLDRMRQ